MTRHDTEFAAPIVAEMSGSVDQSIDGAQFVFFSQVFINQINIVHQIVLLLSSKRFSKSLSISNFAREETLRSIILTVGENNAVCPNVVAKRSLVRNWLHPV